jgi:NTP pyrophosphatase (non-canonical NTP hydrolase)
MMEDDKTTVKELKQLIQKFNKDRDWDQFHNAKDLGIAIATEAAELLEHFIYKSGAELEDLFKGEKREEVDDEIADVLWATLMFAERYDIDISNALKKKIDKTALKYPINKARGSNKKYTEL